MSGRAVLIEPIGGASGNMLLGAFLDAGLTSEQVESWLRPLQLGHWRLMVERAQKHEIRAVYADYAVDSAGPSLSLAEVTEKVGKFPLSPAVVSQADSVLRKLAGARERSSGQPPDEQLYSAAEAIDLMLDVVGFCCIVEHYQLEAVYCRPLPIAFGAGHHGRPHPRPLLTELTCGIPIRPIENAEETVTVTGAAILSTCARFHLPGLVTPEAVGYGCGRSDFAFPNVCRIQLLQVEPKADFEGALASGECQFRS